MSNPRSKQAPAATVTDTDNTDNADAARSSIGPRFGPAAGGLNMADIPPNTDSTTERNHSRAGGEDQQQSAVSKSCFGAAAADELVGCD